MSDARVPGRPSRLFDALPSFADLRRGAEVLADGTMDRRCRLAVTGLRRSGKTVFLTSLVQHLLSGKHLAFLEVEHEKRLIGVRLDEPLAGLPAFPYKRFADGLAAPTPDWPTATDRLTSISLAVRFRPRHPLTRRLKPQDTLKLEIVDYPGEWLLDLPLLDQDYEAWSAATLDLGTREPRDRLLGDWGKALDGLDPDAAATPATAEHLASLYTAYLLRCQEAGLSLTQPGRFTMPGDLAGSTALHFVPLPPGDRPSGSLRALMAARYEDYRQFVVRAFYEDHFAKLDRQVVLVDLLETLNRGPGVFADTQRALEAIMQSFAYGRSGWLSRLLRPRIDRLLFAATKADHVAANQHPNLRVLLQVMVEQAARGAKFEGVQAETLALASVRSTDTVRMQHHGQHLSCVRGILRDSRKEEVIFPGEIPPGLPEPDDWSQGRFRFLAFAPRPLGGNAIDHVRLDQAIEFLLGDRLR